MGWGNESEYKWFMLLDQDGCHTHIWYKPLKILFLWKQKADDFETWYAALVTRFIQMMTLG